MGRTGDFIVAGGKGYFLRFLGDSPEMTSDPLVATRMSLKAAESTANRIDDLGFHSQIIEILKVARFMRIAKKVAEDRR